MSFGWLMVLAATTGFISLSYELMWYRAWSFASLGAPSVFGMLLAFYLAGLANGSVRSRRFCRDREATGSRAQLLAIVGFLVIANAISWAVVPIFGRLATVTHWVPSLLLVFVATTFLGAVLPLVSHFGIRGDSRAGVNLSYVFLANIVGSAAGTILTGFVLMDVWPLRTIAIFTLCLASVLVACVLAACKLDRTRLAASLAGLAALTAVAVVATPRVFGGLWERLLLKKSFKPSDHLAQVVENRSGIIAVTQDGTVYGGGAYDGRFNVTLDHDRNFVIRAYAVAALHPAPREVLMIGLGTGSWAQVIANLPGVERLTVVEINPGYLDIIRGRPEVASLLSNPRAEIVIDDGRRWLLRHPERRFDVIVSNTTWHFRSLVTNLLSREFLELLRPHLKPGGVAFYNTTGSLDCTKTALATYPHVLEYLKSLAVSDAPLEFDRARLYQAVSTMRIDGKPVVADGASLDKILPGTVKTGEALSQGAAVASVITDDNMIPEFRSWTPVEVSPVKWLRRLLSQAFD